MSNRNAEIVIGLQRERMERAEARVAVLTAALEAVLKVRPSNWDDDEDPEQVAAWTKVVAALQPSCANHPDRLSRTNLDGDELCQECADAWVRGEGAHAAWLEAEEEGKAP